MSKEISTELFEVTKVINNLRQHNFEIADYKLCKQEAEVVAQALELYRLGLKMEGIDIAESWKRMAEALKVETTV